jgi:hypothetical protein
MSGSGRASILAFKAIKENDHEDPDVCSRRYGRAGRYCRACQRRRLGWLSSRLRASIRYLCPCLTLGSLIPADPGA